MNPGYEYIDIKFQEGPVQENGVNGTQIEGVIQLLIHRLNGHQVGPFPCEENKMALIKLEEAKMWLHKRTADRLTRNVEGTNQK